jgi:hypothetical protein
MRMSPGWQVEVNLALQSMLLTPESGEMSQFNNNLPTMNKTKNYRLF